jgi:hypothetical protein
MDTKMLRVRAAGTALVVDLDAQEAGARRFVGRAHQATHADGRTEWAPSPEPHAVRARPEYLDALRAGELEPADEATAKAAGLAWTPGRAEAPGSMRPPAGSLHDDKENS